jgi:quercetin dioxygenase-like cupin family protein
MNQNLNQVEPKHPTHNFSYDGVMLAVFHVNKGEGLPAHDHIYSHATVCHSGSIIVRKEGKELVMTKDTQPVNLIAGEWHEIEALENGTVFVNVFAERKS